MRIFWVAVCLGAAVLHGWAQTGEIRLTVQDPSGAAMQASGRLLGPAGATRGFLTDAQGAADLKNLPFGHYRLEIAKKSFTTQSIEFDVQSPAPVTRVVFMALSSQSERLEVVGITPLPGSDQPLSEIAAPVQIVDQRDLADSGALDLSNFLNQRLSGVNVNELQGNPFQPDVNYRGYTASPLLGTPEGISVYMDGVRLNQPFGDVVSWDLIPRVAVSEAALMPGSNPLFGLNTLGGAVSIQTKDGASAPGTDVEVSGGSWGRRSVEAEHGGSTPRGLNWYLAGNLFHEDGWRAHSPSDVRQAFAKLGWQNARTTVSLSSAYADNQLTGNGLQELRLLARDYASVYTIPDVTNNRSPFLDLNFRRTVTPALTVAGNTYFRYIRADTLNADVNTDSLGGTVDQPVTDANGLLTHTFSKQNNYGASGQATWLRSHNRLTAGGGYDRSSARFQQYSQYGYLNPDRSVTPVDAFNLDTRVDLHGRIHTASLYASDTVSARGWAVTLSGRYNRTVIDNRDLLNPGGGAGSLDGHDVFGRFNPAVGVTYAAKGWLTAYASYSEGSRAPTSIELGCADPATPCKLPNALAGDPPLRQVVTRTVEAGLRGGRETGMSWSAGFFRGTNRDDILFVSSPQTGFGYFKNFGETRRQGAEFTARGRVGRFTLGGNYTYLQATYQSTELLDGSSNSTNDGGQGLDGNIQIQPGDRIPLTPRHMGKLFANSQATSKLSVDLDWVLASRSIARGNENNLNQPDGVYYLGPGSSPGYGVVNAALHYQFRKHLEAFVEVNNLFNHRYYSGAQLGPTGFTASGAFIARPFGAVGGEYPIVHSTFYAPGAPIGVWGGIRVHF